MNRQGQSCSSTSRVLVHRELHDGVLEEMVQLVEKLPVGFLGSKKMSWVLLFLKYSIKKSWNLFHLQKKMVHS
ncbi:MAG: hypothetical protein CM1200mP30_17890 [Pseudomonadota bacterium]|nr:MAG: hypothetical protein CM1200mP30_17890 [Pseudomonadota bacterium]